MLCFFPWLKIREKKAFDGFELIPYKRGASIDSLDKEQVEAVDLTTQPFVTLKDQPVTDCTLLRVSSNGVTEDLNDEERDAAFLFAELIAVSCLSIRDFFQYGRYCNRDNFSLFIQRYEQKPKHVAILSKRRDGTTWNSLPLDKYRVQKPEHVHLSDTIKIDENLLNSLLLSKDLEEWDKITDSLLFYNLANRDSPDARDFTEIIFLVSAFERLISTKPGNEDALAEGLVSLLVPKKEIPLTGCERIAAMDQDRFRNSSSIRDIWVRDLYRFRNSHAHGNVDATHPTVWSSMNHLLLGSFIYPVVLKLFLKNLNLYTLTEKDEACIEAFEKLTCAEHFEEKQDATDRAEPNNHPWNSIISETSSELIWDRIAQKIEEQFPETGK